MTHDGSTVHMFLLHTVYIEIKLQYAHIISVVASFLSKAFHFLRGRGMQCGSSCVFTSFQNVLCVYCICIYLYTKGQMLDK